MKKAMWFAAGACAGAAVGYFLDPESGRCRRAHAREKVLSAQRRAVKDLSKSLRYASGRAQGVVSRAASLLSGRHRTDGALAAHVRSRLGHVLREPNAVEVKAHDGQVELRGSVLSDDIERLLEDVLSLPGVTGVDNLLEVRSPP